MQSPASENKSQLDPYSKECNESNFMKDPAVMMLRDSLLQMHLPELNKEKSSLDELLQNQHVLLESIEHENFKFQDNNHLKNLGDLMSRSKIYHVKLLQLRKEMTRQRERLVKIKRRAIKLQQLKQKERVQRQHERDIEIERERQLIAQTSSVVSEVAMSAASDVAEGIVVNTASADLALLPNNKQTIG